MASVSRLFVILEDSRKNIERLLKLSPMTADALHKLFGKHAFTAAWIFAGMLGEGRPGWEKDITAPGEEPETAELTQRKILGYLKDDFIKEDGLQDLKELIPVIQIIESRPELKKHVLPATSFNQSELVGEIVYSAIEIYREKSGIGKHSHKVIKELPDGWKWIDLQTLCSSEEGFKMGHCGTGVGMSSEYLDKNSATMVSLRDNKNKPHVTMMMINHKKTGRPIFYDIVGKQNDHPAPKYIPTILSFIKEMNGAIMTPRNLPKEDFKNFISVFPGAVFYLEGLEAFGKEAFWK